MKIDYKKLAKGIVEDEKIIKNIDVFDEVCSLIEWNPKIDKFDRNEVLKFVIQERIRVNRKTKILKLNEEWNMF